MWRPEHISGSNGDGSVPQLTPWESEPAHCAPQRDVTHNSERTAGVPVYLAGAIGTVLAGGLFPLAIFAIVLFGSAISGNLPSIAEVGGAAIAILFGFLFGCLIAGVAVVCIFPTVGALDWVAGLQPWRRVLVSCAGGWCGFASVAAISEQRAEGFVYVLQFGAMALGQLGAALMIRRLCGREPRPLDGTSVGSNQVPLRKLFGITTAVALAAAVLTSLPIAPQTLTAMGFAAACQAFIAACYVIVRRASNEAPREPLATDVSRETTVATFLD